MAQLIAVAGTRDDRRTGGVIFVHGLDGDARRTWQTEDIDDSFWPQWLGEDLGRWSLVTRLRSWHGKGGLYQVHVNRLSGAVVQSQTPMEPF